MLVVTCRCRYNPDYEKSRIGFHLKSQLEIPILSFDFKIFYLQHLLPLRALVLFFYVVGVNVSGKVYSTTLYYTNGKVEDLAH